MSVPRALRAFTVRRETWATCTQAHVCSFQSAPASIGFGWESSLCPACQGDHPIRAVSQIKLKYLLGGLWAPGKAGVWPRPWGRELRQLSHVARDGCGTKGQDCSPAREIRQGSRIHRGLRQAWRGSWGVLTGRDDCMGSQTESRARGGRVAGLEGVLAGSV